MRLEARKCADDFDCFYPPDNFCGRGQCTDQMVATDLTIHDAVSMYLLDESMGKRRYGPIDSWDTSDVTDMSELFCSKGCTVYMDHSKTFNADLSKWDTSRVTTIARMFAGTQNLMVTFHHGTHPRCLIFTICLMGVHTLSRDRGS